MIMGGFNLCEPEEKEGSMFGIRLSPTVTRERLTYFIPYFLSLLKLLHLTTRGEIPPSLGLYELCQALMELLSKFLWRGRARLLLLRPCFGESGEAVHSEGSCSCACGSS